MYEGGVWMHVCGTCVHGWMIPQGGLPVNWVSRLLVSVSEAWRYIWASGEWCVCLCVVVTANISDAVSLCIRVRVFLVFGI